MEVLSHSEWQHRNVISMSRVCKSWREAVISYPLLWNTIYDDSETVTRMCLERSGSSPLTLVLSDFDTWSSNTRRLVGTHAGRFETLSLIGSQPCGLQEISKSLSSCGKPLLRELTLWSAASFDHARFGLYESLLSPTLATETPNLRKIHFSSFPLIPQPCALRHLTNAELFGLGATFTNAVLDLLANNPRLERVAIGNMDGEDEWSHREDQSITLPHLRHFLIYRCEAIDILRCLHFPCSESLQIDIQDSFKKSRFPAIYQQYSVFQFGSDLRFYQVHIGGDPEFHVKLHDWSLGEVVAKFGELPPKNAEILGPSTIEFIKHLHFREVQGHSVIYHFSPSEAFSHLGRLETLTLDCFTASLEKIFPVLANVTRCPLLHTLIVRLPEGEAVGRWNASLFDVVMARKDRGHAVQRLRVVVPSEHVTACSGLFGLFVEEVEILVRELGKDDGESWLIWGD